MFRKGILFVISGPSGVGKGTIKDALLNQVTGIDLSVSATTRKPREGEVNGIDYFFVDVEDFLYMIKNDAFLEWAQVYSNMYGTPCEFVENRLNCGQDVLLEIDIQGALQVKRRMSDGVFIFIAPPSIDVLASRLQIRGTDSENSVIERLAACENEMHHIKYYDYVVVNDDLNTAVDKICSILTAERCKIKNYDLE